MNGSAFLIFYRPELEWGVGSIGRNFQKDN